MAETNSVPETDREEEETGRGMDPELKALGAIMRILDKQGECAAERIVAYIHNRFVESVKLVETLSRR